MEKGLGKNYGRLGVRSSARFTISATDSFEIPRLRQNADSSQLASDFVPLLELHEKQHRAMFSRVIIRASFTMCSQVATNFRLDRSKGTRQ
jgi:hypothetical protein